MAKIFLSPVSSPSFRGRTSPVLKPSGSALIITLFFIVLITLVTLGFLTTSRLERSVASSHLEKMRAGLFAREGVEQTVATLRKETSYRYKTTYTDPADNSIVQKYFYRNYITQPGELVVPNAPNRGKADQDQKELNLRVALSTGQSTLSDTADAVLQGPDLNTRILSETNSKSRLITDREDADGKAVVMRLKWVYVRANKKAAAGEPAYVYDTNEQPTFDSDRPIVGRYAYWTDDESSKINYNLAWKHAGKGVDELPLAHPYRVNLMALKYSDGSYLPEKSADQIHNLAVTQFFNTFADARRIDLTSPDTKASELLAFNKFDLTHYNHDPDTTFFGEDRILLTTNRDLVPKYPDGKYARKFIDILRDDKPAASLDPGVLEDIAGGQPDWRANVNGSVPVSSKNKLDIVVRNMLRYVSTTNWPLNRSGGQSFKDKYYNSTPDSEARLAQIVINIIDYVRAKESPQKFIAPMRFALDGNNKYSIHPDVAYGAVNSYQGVCRSPYITELGCYMEDTKVTKTVGKAQMELYPFYFKFELHIPPRYGIVDPVTNVPGIDFTHVAGDRTKTSNWFCTFTETDVSDNGGNPKLPCAYYYENSTGKVINLDTASTRCVPIETVDIQGGPVLLPGKYITITKKMYRNLSYGDYPSPRNMRVGLFYGVAGTDELIAPSSSRWPRVNIGPQYQPIPFTMNPPSRGEAGMASVETDDPRANVNPLDWFKGANNRNSFGAQNSVYTVGQTPKGGNKSSGNPAGDPQQDTDGNGKISDASLYMPPPKGAKGNELGRITSVGEMGYINTGVDSRSGKASTSWRTIRLQPNNYGVGSGVLPDWAFMDLFAAPNVTAGLSNSVTNPHETGVGGRVNVNSHVSPFDSMVRNRALVGLLKDCTGLTTPAETVALNIYQRNLSPSRNKSFGKVYGYPWQAKPGLNDPNGYDTPGEICEIDGVSDSGEESESVFRQISSLITARGGVFSVYTIGQAVQQAPNGKMTVTAEQRFQSVVERYLDNRGTVGVITNENDPEADDVIRFRQLYTRNLSP